MYVVFFLLIITGNYIWGELVVPHYRNVFSGVLVVFFLAKSTRGVLTGKDVLCLFSFLLAALSFHIFWNSNLFPLSIYLSTYLYLSLFYLFKVAPTLGTALPSPLPMDVHPLQRVLEYLQWLNSCLLQIVTVFIFNDRSTFWLAFSPLQQFHAAHQLHLEFCGPFITSLSILIQFLDCCRNELI